jgi:hypothetical protein
MSYQVVGMHVIGVEGGRHLNFVNALNIETREQVNFSGQALDEVIYRAFINEGDGLQVAESAINPTQGPLIDGMKINNGWIWI